MRDLIKHRETCRRWKQAHKKEISVYNKKYKENHKEEISEYWKEYTKKYNQRRNELNHSYKKNFLDVYGRKCMCCGETRIEFLTLDHVQGQIGKKKENPFSAYKKAAQEFRLDLYQVLCMNCNFSKGRYGYCPHTRETVDSKLEE
jgi:DNA-directed RNA polymerase subunit N (RpoN/RPB10)